ncbi:MAG: FumA C-terminus/TtdB family hydratase beta subunit [Candidatus Bathyarchaeia archaeon]
MTFNLMTPLSESDIRRLHVGDIVYITGTLVTARDAAHKRIHQYLMESKELPFNLEGLALFHCGPLAKKVDGEWVILAAGPTTSVRMEAFEHEVIEKLKVRLIIGKGGMGEKTKRAMMEHGAAYAMFTGGVAVLAAKYVKRVRDVLWMDLGMPEAVWFLEVENFGPLIIAMDSHGANLFERVAEEAGRRMDGVLGGLRGSVA